MKRHLTPSRLALALALCTPEGLAQSLTMFNTDILRARGIPASVATYFQTASRFPPGINHLTLVVNGTSRGTVSATFNDQGALCADANFLKAAGILTKQSEGPAPAQQGACPALPVGTEIKLQPGRQRVELLVPPQLVDNSAPEAVYVSGGSAALLNYNLYATGNHSRHSRSQTFYGHTESGFNADNWVVRSYDSYSGHGDKARFHHQSAWVQRTFPAAKSTLQAGQLTLNSPLFSAPAFNGLQVQPESALLKTDNGVRVTGIAPSAARVEVRQGGALIYSTLVPAGPFVLDNLPLNNASQDLEVSVIENSGGQRRFIVPAASFSSNFVPVQQGWTAAIGQPRETGRDANDLKSHGFITATATFPVKVLNTNITTGLMAAQRYTSVGLNAETSLWKGSSTYLRFLAARDARTGTQGTITQAGHSMALGETLSATLSAAFYTPGFRYLTESSQPDTSRRGAQKRMYGASLGWRNDMLGFFSLGMTRSEQFDNTADNHPSISWSQNIGPTSVSLSMSPRSGQRDDDMYYLHVSLPLGKAHTSFSASKEGRYTRASASVSQQLNDSLGYSVGTSTSDNRRYGFNGSLNLQPRYTRLYGNYSYNGHDSHSWSGSMNGSVMHDGHGMLFSPHSVHDTFGVVNVPGLPHARIQTPSGTVWTNGSGRAAVPSVTPYSRSRVELVTQGLPRNVEVSNAASITEAGRGAVSRVSLKAERHRKILLQVSTPDGKSFPQGMAVLDGQGHYLTITGTDSDIYLDAEHTRNGLVIENDSGKHCTLNFTASLEPPKDNEPYETVSAICR